jgi:AcrR family transcriptional regulator
VAAQHQEASTGAQDRSRREERAHRILDAAADLILRWGYNKTTVDDIARQAGVAKGTIYLHWNTREALFRALMHRERLALLTDLRQRIGADPLGGTLHAMIKYMALALMSRPLLKAVLLRDMDVIGKLAHSRNHSAAYTERLAGFTSYLELLRERGLVRTDLSLRSQMYMVSAIFLGFFLAAPLVPDTLALPDEELADMLAETVHRTLENDHIAADETLQVVSRTFMQYLERDMLRLQALMQQEIAS